MGENPKVFVDVRNISKYYDNLEVLANISFQVNKTEFFVIMGPSGCGKTTLLKIIAGIENPSSGSVLINGEPPNPRVQSIGYVFQEDSLFPWRTVEENIRFGLEIKRLSSESTIKEIISLVGLKGFEHYYPRQISGGMRKRAAIARALAVNPILLLMDEPFSDLDAQTRWIMCRKLWEIHKELKKTTILVTHDIEEAVYLGDRIMVLTKRPGRIKKIIHVNLQRPRSRFSKEFIDYMKIITELLREEVPEI